MADRPREKTTMSEYKLPIVPDVDDAHKTVWYMNEKRWRVELDKETALFSVYELESYGGPAGRVYGPRIVTSSRSDVQEALRCILYPPGSRPSPEPAFSGPVSTDARLGRPHVYEPEELKERGIQDET